MNQNLLNQILVNLVILYIDDQNNFYSQTNKNEN